MSGDAKPFYVSHSTKSEISSQLLLVPLRWFRKEVVFVRKYSFLKIITSDNSGLISVKIPIICFAVYGL